MRKHFGRWAFGIGQPPRDRRGRTGIAKGRSVRSAGNVLTTLSCSASGIFAICCDLTRPTITRRARTCHWIRMRPYRVLLRGQGVFFAAQSSADCITSTAGFDLRQAQVHTFTPDRSDQPFDEAVLPRRAWRGRLVPDAHGAQSA
jgi:hypothetical protein